MAAIQHALPDGGYVNETGTTDEATPAGLYVNEASPPPPPYQQLVRSMLIAG